MMNDKQKFKMILMEGSHKSYFMLFLFCFGFIIFFSVLIIILRRETTLGGFIEGVSIESVGMLFDIFVLGVIFHYFYERGEKQREIERYKEEIDNFRDWDEKEAMFRHVANIKRLIKLGVENLNLEYCFLNDANLNETHLKGANLERANLERANLTEVNLSSASLKDANLVGADMEHAILTGANLEGANLERIWLKFANLEDAIIIGANFEGADLEGAILTGANLEYAEGLTVDMLSNTKSLYQVKGLSPEIKEKLKKKNPFLFTIEGVNLGPFHL